MSKGLCFFVVALGLAIAGAPSQAQEDTYSRQIGAGFVELSSDVLSIPFPAYSVGSEPNAETRQRLEEEARQREIADLIAQQGMNAATQAMNVATQRMALYALWSTVFVGVGTVLLIWTLWFTRQANRAAQSAVDVTREIGRNQIRAYVSMSSAGIVFKDEKSGPKIAINFKNFGQSPAKSVLAVNIYKLGPKKTSERIFFNAEANRVRMFSVPPGCGFTIDIDRTGGWWSSEYTKAVREQTMNICVGGFISYKDQFNRRHWTTFKVRNQPGNISSEVQGMQTCEKGNNSN